MNNLTGRYYYGMHSTDDLDDGYIGSGKRLRYSIRKYGEENHKREIIEFCKNEEKLKKREREIVNLNEIAKKDCMNLMVGGKGGFISDEQQMRRSKAATKGLYKKLECDPEFRKILQRNGTNSLKKARINGNLRHVGF